MVPMAGRQELWVRALTDNFRLAFSTFWGHRLRSLLTLLGIVIGAATVVAMMALLEGLLGWFLSYGFTSATSREAGAMVAADDPLHAEMLAKLDASVPRLSLEDRPFAEVLAADPEAQRLWQAARARQLVSMVTPLPDGRFTIMIQCDLKDGPAKSIDRLFQGKARRESVPDDFQQVADNLADGPDRRDAEAARPARRARPQDERGLPPRLCDRTGEVAGVVRQTGRGRGFRGVAGVSRLAA